MNEIHSKKVDRLTGAGAISEKAIDIGRLKGIPISKCTWDIGEDCTHEYAHRLELSTGNKSVHLYFNEAELTNIGNMARDKRTEARLSGAADQLRVRVPSRTYEFKN